MKKIKKKSGQGRFKRVVVGGLAVLSMLSSMTFVGCVEQPETPTPDNGDLPPVVDVKKNHANNISELQAQFPTQTEAFVSSQLDRVLTDLGIDDDVLADYNFNVQDGKIVSVKYTFEYNKEIYTAFATYSEPVEIDTIANSNEADIAQTLEAVIENSVTKYDKQLKLNHVATYKELKTNYSTKLSQYLNTQFEYLIEKHTITGEITEVSNKVTASSEGIQEVEFTFTQDGKKQAITVTYQTPISLDAIANYPEHEESKEEVVDAMVDATSQHEYLFSTYSTEFILANFQDEINANLFSGVEACATNICNEFLRKTYDVNNIEQYQWRFGEIKEREVQNLQLYFIYKEATARYHFVFNVSLKNPTSIEDLAKANNPAEFDKISFSNQAYFYGYLDRQQKAGYLELLTGHLAEQDSTFDYANAMGSIAYTSLSGYQSFDLYYSLGNEIRKIFVSVRGDETSTSEVLSASIKKNLETGNFRYGITEQFMLEDNALDWVTPAIENENTN